MPARTLALAIAVVFATTACTSLIIPQVRVPAERRVAAPTKDEIARLEQERAQLVRDREALVTQLQAVEEARRKGENIPPQRNLSDFAARPAPVASDTITRSDASKDMTKARVWVDFIKDDIANKRDEHQVSRWGFVGSTFAMVATVAGLGATGTAGAPIAALSLASGATAMTGSTLPIGERIDVYNTALEAIECIESGTSVFQFSDTERRMLLGQANGDTTKPTLATIVQSLLDDQSALERNGDIDPNAPTTAADKKAIADALQKLSDASAASNRVFAIEGGAARVLVDNTAILVQRMNRALTEREPNLRALLFSLVPNPQDIIKRGGAPAPASKAKSASEAAAGFSSSDLNRHLAQAQEAVAAVNAVLARTGTTDPVPAARACLEKAGQGFARRPLTVTLRGASAIAPGEQTTFEVEGGTRPYHVDLPGSASTNLSKTQEEDGSVLKVKIDAVDGARADVYTVAIRDTSTPPQNAIQPITVKAPAAPKK